MKSAHRRISCARPRVATHSTRSHDMQQHHQPDASLPRAGAPQNHPRDSHPPGLAYVWLTDVDVARALGISRAQVWRMAASGRLPAAIKTGPNTTRWRSDQVQAYMDAFSAAGQDASE